MQIWGEIDFKWRQDLTLSFCYLGGVNQKLLFVDGFEYHSKYHNELWYFFWFVKAILPNCILSPNWRKCLYLVLKWGKCNIFHPPALKCEKYRKHVSSSCKKSLKSRQKLSCRLSKLIFLDDIFFCFYISGLEKNVQVHTLIQSCHWMGQC